MFVLLILGKEVVKRHNISGFIGWGIVKNWKGMVAWDVTYLARTNRH
jgi:hypothetical protein